MFKPNDYDLNKEYRQRQLHHSSCVRQAEIANIDKKTFVERSVQVASSIILQALTTEPKQSPVNTQYKFNHRINAT